MAGATSTSAFGGGLGGGLSFGTGASATATTGIFIKFSTLQFWLYIFLRLKILVL